MPMISRRTVLAGLGAAAVARGAWLRAAPASLRLSILTDEISQDFGHACEVASRDFGMGLVDLRREVMLTAMASGIAPHWLEVSC